ncbi:NADH-quinone oxidoreductase subunit N [Balneolaceae bacterium ANBcel3]|nr:NADH-quinone oxidoreductase subunit N [Balneolaceae bacterium ANBcel3]
MAEHIIDSIFLFLPEITLTLTLVAAVLADLVLKERNRMVAWVVFAGLLVTGVFVLRQCGLNESIFSDMIAVDPFSVFFKGLLTIAGLFIVLFSVVSKELEQNGRRIGEYYMLLTGVLLGMFLMAGATNVLMMYLAFELTSISSYVLSGFTKNLRKSAEASMKYIIYGSVSSGFLLYGLTLLIGITGSTDIYGIRDALQSSVGHDAVLYLSVMMILVGFSYKITVLPFHFWAPDVYEGAPTPITTFLATASKIAGFALLMRFFRISFVDGGITDFAGYEGIIAVIPWNIIVAILATLTMVGANLMALWQDNIKRLLAYSSISHAGFILMGLVLLNDEGMAAMMVYLAIYLVMNMGAFFIAMIISDRLHTERISDYQGLGRSSPFLGVSMAIFLVALAGFPPTAGFIAKIFIFGAVIHAGWIWLVVVAGFSTVISLFYYIRVVKNMFLSEPPDSMKPIETSRGVMAVVIMLLIPVFVFGIWFSPLLSWARDAVVLFGL